MHNAAFRELGLDWTFVAFEVQPGHGRYAAAAMRDLGIGGLSVTMPHKEAVLAALDELSPTAVTLGAVNTVVRVGKWLTGHNTDGAGFLEAVIEGEGFDPAGKRCVVLGAGGAARAVVLALAEAGASDVMVVNRSPERAARAVALAAPVTRVATLSDVDKADLVVNATPLGMDTGDALPVDPTLLGRGQLVVDLVYHHGTTPLVEAARARGASAATGLGMLIHQAGHAFRLWTGEKPPLAVMSAAALGELARRRLAAPEVPVGILAPSATGPRRINP